MRMMLRACVLSAVIIDIGHSSSASRACPISYQAWRVENGLPAVSSSEVAAREDVYNKRCADLDARNAASNSFLLGPNTRFIDRFPQEIAALRASKKSGGASDAGPGGGTPFSPSDATGDGFSTATKVDWRDATSNPGGLSVVTGIKNQGQCGACWSFSVLAALESAVALGHGGLLNDLSEQELVDCDPTNGGCDGGSFQSAFTYLKASGSRLYDDYPWVGTPGPCSAADFPPAVGLSDYTAIGKCDVEEAKRGLWEVGPLSVSIDASCSNFEFYSSGLFDSGCGSASNDHAVTLVGFMNAADNPANDDLGADYFIAKNSWGTTWGVKGYMYIAASLVDPSNPSSACGVSNVLKEPLGVLPSSTTAFTNTTYPPPLVPGNDDQDPGGGNDDEDSSSVRCTNVLVNGQTMFDDDKHADDDEAAYAAHKSEWQCKAVEWLASPHKWFVWVIFFGGLVLFAMLLCSCLRWVCRKLCKCCRCFWRCLCPCCCFSNYDEDEEEKGGRKDTHMVRRRHHRHHQHQQRRRQRTQAAPSPSNNNNYYDSRNELHEPLFEDSENPENTVVVAEEYVDDGYVEASESEQHWERQRYVPPPNSQGK